MIFIIGSIRICIFYLLDNDLPIKERMLNKE